jgi:hypothetical protein
MGTKHRRGDILHLEELRALENGALVWVYLKEPGEPRPRVSNACVMTRTGSAFTLSRGCFSLDFDLDDEDIPKGDEEPLEWEDRDGCAYRLNHVCILKEGKRA